MTEKSLSPEEAQAYQKRNTKATVLLLNFIGGVFLLFSLSLGGEMLDYTKKEKNVATITEIKTVNVTGKRIYSGEGGEKRTADSPALPLTQYIATFSFERQLGKKYTSDVELKTVEGHNQPEHLSPLEVGDKVPIHYWPHSPSEFSQVTQKRLILNFIGSLLFSSVWFLWAHFVKTQKYKAMRIMAFLYAGVLGGTFWNSVPGCEKRYEISATETQQEKTKSQ
jgi:hypothetical protein